MIKKVEVEVSKEGFELVDGIAKFLGKAKAEIEDNGGWDAADDIPGIMTAAMTELMPAMEGAMKISEEAKTETVAFAKGVSIGLGEIVAVFLAPKK